MEILTSAKQMQYKLQQADYGNVSVELAQKISTTHQVPGTNTLMLSHVGMNALQPNMACRLFHYCEWVSTVLLRKGSHECHMNGKEPVVLNYECGDMAKTR